MTNDVNELHLFFYDRNLIQDDLEQGYDAQYIVSSSYMDEWFLFFSNSLVEKLKPEQELAELIKLLSGGFYSDSPYIFDNKEAAQKISEKLKLLDFSSIANSSEELESLESIQKLFKVISEDNSEALIGYFP